jgi:hypothetical protein
MKAIQILKDLKVKQHKELYPNMPDHAIPQPKYNDKTANGLTKCIIDYLTLLGWQAERINTMGRVIDNRKTITDVLGKRKTIGSTNYIPTTGTKGSADISSTIYGRSVKIEVKMKDTQSKHQKQYQEMIEKSGGQYWLVRSFDEFYERLNKFTSDLDNPVKLLMDIAQKK